jgi:diguanylate cyclase (GGDEF)-like protein
MTVSMQWYPAALWKLFLPAALIGAALLARTRVDALGSDYRVILDNLPYLLCAIALFMANQFNRCRLLLAAVGVALFYWVVQSQLQASLSDPAVERTYLSLSLALPVLGFYLLLLPERGIFNPYGLASCVGFAVLLLICLQLGPWLPQVNAAAGEYYAPRPLDGYLLSLGASLLVGLVVALGIALLGSRNEEVELALLGAFCALYLTLALLHLQDISVVMSSVAGVALVWGLLRSSHAMAYRDELTGLPGRRALNERLKMLGNRYAIAMLDIDHFKRFNDTHGHDVGDEVLRLVASRIRQVGAGGTAYRYGGEEFCVVFQRREAAECEEALEQVRAEIADYRMALRDRSLRPVKSREGAKKRGATRIKSGQISVTVSAGLALRSEDNPDAEAVIAAADKKLYQAKRAGRNRVAA